MANDGGGKGVPIRFSKDKHPFKIYPMDEADELFKEIETIQREVGIKSRNNLLLILLRNAVEEYKETGQLHRKRSKDNVRSTTPEKLDEGHAKETGRGGKTGRKKG